jgi:hypothetical protein
MSAIGGKADGEIPSRFLDALVGVRRLINIELVAPAIVGGDEAGASIFGTAAQQSRYAPSRLRSVFSYE